MIGRVDCSRLGLFTIATPVRLLTPGPAVRSIVTASRDAGLGVAAT